MFVPDIAHTGSQLYTREERLFRAPVFLFHEEKERPMAFIEAKDGTQLHVKDMGSGHPVVLIHGWPLTGDMFESRRLHFSKRATA